MSEGEICARHFATRQPMRVRWECGVITQAQVVETAPAGLWIAPAMVDLQINGYGGIDFQQDNLTVEDLLNATRQLRAVSCTRFLATLITDEWGKLTNRLRRLREFRAQSPELQKAIAGWHIEGPFLSSVAGLHGAHDPALMLDPTPERIRELRTITEKDPLLLTIAPERAGSVDAIALAKSLGIKISLGHTDASAEVLRKAVEAGATGFTHLANGCPRELDRHDNILWRALETPGLTASLIPDAIHVSPVLFRMIHRLLGEDAIYYTTDAMAAAGAGPGKYRIGKTEVEVSADQVVRQPGKTNFAGSALRPIDGIFRATEMLGSSWQEAWGKFSSAPARLMGLPYGLDTGKAADFCVLKFEGKNQLSELKMIGDF